VGDKLYSLVYGEIMITEIKKHTTDYPIICEGTGADGDEIKLSYALDGKYHFLDQLPTLFLTNPFEKLNQERVIEVKVVNGHYYPRVCIKVVDGRALCYCDAETLEQAKNATSTQVIGVGQWRELQPEQPETKQPKEIVQ
jgi:hypothetical protein